MTAFDAIGRGASAALLTLFGFIFQGYVLSMLWGWFMVPALGIPKLTIVPAIGIATVVSYLTHQGHHCNCKKKKSFYEIFVEPSIEAAIILCFGWIVHLFM